MNRQKRHQNRKPEVVEKYYNFYITVKAEQINCSSRITQDVEEELRKLARNGKLNGHKC